MISRLRLLTSLLPILTAAQLEATEFHVALTGNDADPGTEHAPFLTLERARDAVRELKKSEALTQPVSVVVHQGIYQMLKPLVMTAMDSGTSAAPVVYRAKNRDTVRLLGGRIIPSWNPVTDPAIEERLDPAARGHVVWADLAALGVNDFGEMKPDEKWTDSLPVLELFFNDRPMTLARWPNDGTVLTGELKVQNGNEIRENRSGKGTTQGIFTYDGTRPERWSKETNILLHGYWWHDWADQRLRVESIDTEHKTITLPANPQHEYGFRKGQPYYAYNLLCELDKPCEWYLDHATGVLYFWPPEQDTKNALAFVSVLPELIQTKETSCIEFRDFIFEGARGTAVRISGGSAVQIVGGTVRNTGSWAVSASGKRHRVADLEIYNTGHGGISLYGGDRATLSPGENLAENNHIHHYSRWKPVYRPGIRLSGVGNRAAHNLIHDAPHMAVGLDGNEHLLEFNEIHHVVEHSNDAGAVYMGRDWGARGNIIRYNFLHDINGYEGKGAVGVYLDDQFSSVHLFGNVFHRVKNAAFVGGGDDTTIENNLFVECNPAIHIDARGLGWQSGFDVSLAESLEKLPFRSEPWRSRYPQLLTLLEDPDRAAPKGNVIARNIEWKGKWDDIEKKAYPHLVFQHNVFGPDPKFVDEKAGTFELSENSPAFQIGFKRIPFEEIGLRR